jgi:hypothetical protein
MGLVWSGGSNIHNRSGAAENGHAHDPSGQGWGRVVVRAPVAGVGVMYPDMTKMTTFAGYGSNE